MPEHFFQGTGIKGFFCSHQGNLYLTVFASFLPDAIVKREHSKKKWVCKGVDCLGANRIRVGPGVRGQGFDLCSQGPIPFPNSGVCTFKRVSYSSNVPGGAFTLGSWALVPEYDTRWALM